MGLSIGFGGSSGTDTSTTTGTQKQTGTVVTSTKKDFSEAAQQKMIYDLLSASGSGIADILAGSNLVGASKSSSSTLLSQDFMAKVAGTLAETLAGTTTTQTTDLTTAIDSTTKGKKKDTKAGFGFSL